MKPRSQHQNYKSYRKSLASFFSGMGSVLNLGGGYLNSKNEGAEKDLMAIANDWRIVGEDLKITINTHKKRS